MYTHLRNPAFADDVLATVLALYMHDKKQPLPSHEEVLICTPETTTEEVISYLGTVFFLCTCLRLCRSIPNTYILFQEYEEASTANFLYTFL